MIKRFHSLLLLSRDSAVTESFYRSLGFEVSADKGTARVVLGDFRLAFMDESIVTIRDEVGISPKGAGIYLYCEVENVDEYYHAIIKKGIKPSSEPKTWPWGKREFALKDPDGYKMVFFSNVG